MSTIVSVYYCCVIQMHVYIWSMTSTLMGITSKATTWSNTMVLQYNFLLHSAFFFPDASVCSVSEPFSMTLPIIRCYTDWDWFPKKLVCENTMWRHKCLQTCLPPPLLCCVLEDTVSPDAPVMLLLAVQLLQRISPWFPFFHIEDEFVLQTAQHGFKPSGIVSLHKKEK